MTGPLLVASDLTVRAGGRTLLASAGLTAAPGSWTTVVGPNGAGKTTFLRALAGLVPAAGRLELGGRPLARLSQRDRARRLALVPQAPVVPFGMVVAHYVLLGRTPHLGAGGRIRGTDLARVADALALVDAEALADRRVDTLSGGELQRVALARALAQGAELLLLDEPTSALDLGRQHAVLDAVDRLCRRRDLAVVSTSHDLTLTAAHADQVVLVAEGRVVATGSPEQVLTADRLTTSYGTPIEVLRHRGRLVVLPWPDTTAVPHETSVDRNPTTATRPPRPDPPRPDSVRPDPQEIPHGHPRPR